MGGHKACRQPRSCSDAPSCCPAAREGSGAVRGSGHCWREWDACSASAGASGSATPLSSLLFSGVRAFGGACGTWALSSGVRYSGSSEKLEKRGEKKANYVGWGVEKQSGSLTALSPQNNGNKYRKVEFVVSWPASLGSSHRWGLCCSWRSV